jgi:predicted Zn-dependent protease
MKALPHAEVIQIEAAEGWLMLGNPLEANEELEKIPSHFRYHPAVLAIRWQVFAAANMWEAAWVISKALCETLPDVAETWICQANTLRKFRGTQEAYEVLRSVVDDFGQEPVIRYNLACYAAQLGKWETASYWLNRCFELRDSFPLKLAALYDPDLKPLWERVNPEKQLGIEISTLATTH